jgi:hypothetical protein
VIYNLLKVHIERSSRRKRWAGKVAIMGEKRNTYIISGKAKRKRPLGRKRLGMVDNVEMYLRETRWGYLLDWSDSGSREVERY